MTEGNVAADIPRIEPGVSFSYRHGWQRLWKSFFDLFLGLILLLAVVLPISLVLAFVIFQFIEDYWTQQVINYAFNFLVYGPLGFGWAYMTLRAVRSEKIEINHLFQAFHRYGQSVLAYLLITVFTSAPLIIAVVITIFSPLLGVMLIIVAVIVAIIVVCKLAFTPFLLLDQKLNAFEAIKASWKMTDGHAGTVFLIYLLGIPIAIAGVLCFIIGIIPAAMWIYMAIASLYHAVYIWKGGIPVQPGSPRTPTDSPGNYPGQRDKGLYPDDTPQSF
jgi:uncharacterized membrane protein